MNPIIEIIAKILCNNLFSELKIDIRPIITNMNDNIKAKNIFK